jgi:hypothetical protein
MDNTMNNFKNAVGLVEAKILSLENELYLAQNSLRDAESVSFVRDVKLLELRDSLASLTEKSLLMTIDLDEKRRLLAEKNNIIEQLHREFMERDPS